MEKRRHFIDCGIAGFTYWEGAMVFNELKVGDRLRLVREQDNRFDPYAVALYYGDFKLGFVSRGENKELSKFCEMGYADIFDVRINRLSPDEHPENQVGVIVYIDRKAD